MGGGTGRCGNGIYEKRLYCKRPILWLASSELLTPIPLTARRVCTTRLWCGGRTHWLGGEGGGGVNILEGARHSSVLYIRKYFVGTYLEVGE
jgi:hypothetical protein